LQNDSQVRGEFTRTKQLFASALAKTLE